MAHVLGRVGMCFAGGVMDRIHSRVVCGLIVSIHGQVNLLIVVISHRIPFYPWIRAGFLLYLISPQTQGAKVLYQTYLHPFLEEHEIAIEDFISSAHDRAKEAGINYL